MSVIVLILLNTGVKTVTIKLYKRQRSKITVKIDFVTMLILNFCRFYVTIKLPKKKIVELNLYQNDVTALFRQIKKLICFGMV